MTKSITSRDLGIESHVTPESIGTVRSLFITPSFIGIVVVILVSITLLLSG